MHVLVESRARKIGVKSAPPAAGVHRSQGGFQLLELMVAVSIGSILMMAIYGSSMGFYRATSNSENQVLASNLAQQVIDNARNSTYLKLLSFLNGSASVSQELSLYDFPPNPSAAMFPRPLLRNESALSGMTYSQSSLQKQFKGTVTETIDNLTPGELNNGQLRVTVLISWKDTRGPHEYRTATTISQTGIHN
jgi:prepilin-type N-terminal cleavage/methylation domain-containing protein